MLYGHMSVPNLYRRVWVGEDASVGYNLFQYYISNSCSYGCLFFKMTTNDLVASVNTECPCEPRRCTVCEYDVRLSESQVNKRLPALARGINTTWVNRVPQSMVFCPGNHVIPSFLTCDTRASCQLIQSSPVCPLSQPASASVQHVPQSSAPSASANDHNVLTEASPVPSVLQFACKDRTTYVHYTLVCDFRPDCKDRSDESFCRHPPCPSSMMTCGNGQCASYLTRGDLVSDCTDDTDEGLFNYATNIYTYRDTTVLEKPFIINSIIL
jgi:hypothetical protein